MTTHGRPRTVGAHGRAPGRLGVGFSPGELFFGPWRDEHLA